MEAQSPVAAARKRSASTLLDPKIALPAIGASFAKLDPRLMIKSPVMFVVEVVAALTTLILIRAIVTGGANLGFTIQITLWLWITVLFANFAEAGRRRARQGAGRPRCAAPAPRPGPSAS